ncbi:hypothetical protein P3L10_030313 [Capsicum annuum]
MESEDKIWMNCLIWSNKYERGVKYFLGKAFERAAQGNEILCPCRDCKNQHWRYRDVVEDHFLSRGFRPSYTKWTFHGQNASSRKTHYPINYYEGSNMCDDIDGLLYYTFRNVDAKSRNGEGVGEWLPEDATTFLNY